MTQSVKVIPLWCCVLGILILTSLHTVPTAWAGPLHDAALSGDFQKVKRLIEKGADVNARDKDGQTPLFWTSSPEGIELLIKKGADVNAQDRLGRTPLYMAAGHGNYKRAKLLIEKGADVNAKDKLGGTPLSGMLLVGVFYSEVSEKDRKEMVRLLIQKGADVNVKDRAGHTPLTLAIDRGYKEVAQLLIQNDADVNAQNDNGSTPLFLTSSPEIIELLIQKGADINAKDEYGRTPLELAIKRGKKEVAKLLRQHGAKMDGTTPKEAEINIRHADSTAKRQLRNLYLTCREFWADKGSSAQCTVKKAFSPFGFRLDKKVELTISPGKDIETNFEVVSKHTQSPNSWRINRMGSIKRIR